MADIGRRLRELGPGSSAVVGFDRADAPGHWFNAVNHEGMVLAVDGQAAQSGSAAFVPPDAIGSDGRKYPVQAESSVVAHLGGS